MFYSDQNNKHLQFGQCTIKNKQKTRHNQPPSSYNKDYYGSGFGICMRVAQRPQTRVKSHLLQAVQTQRPCHVHARHQ